MTVSMNEFLYVNRKGHTHINFEKQNKFIKLLKYL